MKAVILAGGKGTRLRPYTQVVPKPLLPYKEKPILEHIIKYLESHGVTDIYVSLGYLGRLIQNYFSDHPEIKATLHFVEEEMPLGTAGCLDCLRDVLNETFLIVGGDNITELDLGKLLEFHRQTGSVLTPALFQEKNQIPWGVYELGENGEVEAFVEKPTHTYNAGTMIFAAEPTIFKYIPRGPKGIVNLTDHVIPLLLQDRQPMHGFKFEDTWVDIGTVEQYHKLNGDDSDNDHDR